MTPAKIDHKSEIPKGIPSIDQNQLAGIEAVTKRYKDEPSIPTGTVTRCPVCEHDTLVYTNNLTKDIPTSTGVKTITRLPGAECQNCGARAYSSGAQKLIMVEKSKTSRMQTFDAKVTNLSGKQAGLYLANSIQQAAHLAAGARVKITVTDDGNLFVEILRDGEVDATDAE